MYYGQATSYDASGVGVATYMGEKHVSAGSNINEVYPVVAMVLGFKRWSKRSWPISRLEAMHDELIDRILAGKEGAPLLPSDLDPVLPRGLASLTDREFPWVEPSTGRVRRVSLSYVLRFVYYASSIAGQHQGRSDMGRTFCDDPTAAGNQETPEDGGFFDPTIDDDPADSSGPVPLRGSHGPDAHRPTTRAVASATPAMQQSPPEQTLWSRTQDQGASRGVDSCLHTSPGTDDDQDKALIELIRLHRPHLLGYYLAQGETHPMRNLESDPECQDPPGTAKRPRLAFAPSSEQEKAHRMVTSSRLAGKSSDVFVDFVLAMSEFLWHPGVLARLNDLQFGARGLSVTHFQRVGLLDRYRMASTAASLSSDLSVAPPPPFKPLTWRELAAATRSFLVYTQAVCDETTVQLAHVLDGFVAEMEGWKQLSEDDLPVLTWWIDHELERYRNAVVNDLHNGTTTRAQIHERLTPSNPDLQGLVPASLRDKLLSSTTPTTAASQPNRRAQERSAPERKIPKDVLERIPMRDNKEVCLHYLSKRRCNSKDSTVCTFRNRIHFWPDPIPAKVREYIDDKLGRLCPRLTGR
jgi:hypothetical protein